RTDKIEKSKSILAKGQNNFVGKFLKPQKKCCSPCAIVYNCETAVDLLARSGKLFRSNRFRMGIRGLSTYVRQNQLFEEYHLHDTVLVIDGLNLVNTLYFKFQRDNRNDHNFGGDYSLAYVYVRNFFNTLKTCGVVPIVILDGSFDPSLEKLNTKLKRFKTRLSSDYKIYKNKLYHEGINPVLTTYLFNV